VFSQKAHHQNTQLQTERCIQMCLHRKLSTKTHSNRQKRCIQNFAFHMWVGSLDQQSTVGDGSNLVAKMISMVFSKRTVMPHHHHNLPDLRKQRKNLFARVLSSWMQQGIAGIFLPSSLCAWSPRAHDVFVKLLCLKTLLLQESDETRSSRTISKPKTLTLLNLVVSSMPCTFGFVSFCEFLWILKLRLSPPISAIFEKRETMHCTSCEVQFSCCSFSLWGGCCCSKDVRDLLGFAVLLLL
jgi:hypothetical protein